MLCAFWSREHLIYTWHFVYIAHTLSLCTRPLHLKRPRSASGGLLNERLWEVVVLPQGRPCSTLVRVGYATAITAEGKENVSGWCLKVLSGLCFERRRMMKMTAGYIGFQKYLTSVICWAGPVRMLHKGVLLCGNMKPRKQGFLCLLIVWLKTHCWHLGYLAF